MVETDTFILIFLPYRFLPFLPPSSPLTVILCKKSIPLFALEVLIPALLFIASAYCRCYYLTLLFVF